MIVQNNAAQPVLTDEELREIQGTHLVTIRSREALVASVIVAGRAIEQAVLSKLRAPVADERALHIKALQDLRLGVEMDQHYMDDGDAKLAALDAAITALRWSAGALQALNIEADKITLDGETRTVGDILDHADRALASTPVADERAAFEQAMRETYRMVDPLMPPPAGSYARGEHEGIIAALKTVRENFTHAALASAPVAKPLTQQNIFDKFSFLEGLVNEHTYRKIAETAIELCRASAPVAGEAQQPVALVEVSVPHLRSISVKIIPGAPMPNVGDMLYAVPQSSAEDVRNAALEEAASLLDGKWATWLVDRAAHEIRKLKSTPAPTAAEGGQASEALRIVFPAHLRKMWSGGEVQAWLDEHQGVTAPKASAKGSLERYRKWQAERGEAFGAGVNAAADLVKKMVDAYDTDHGSTDPETGTREYPGEGATWVCEMQELEESIRALSAQPGAIRNPLIAEPSGNPGELDCAALAARKEGDGNAN